MSSPVTSPVVALKRFGRLFCKRCLTEAAEVEAWTDPQNAGRLMEELGISLLRANELTGGEKCAVCQAKIKPTV